jgi:hypothetical protein
MTRRIRIQKRRWNLSLSEHLALIRNVSEMSCAELKEEYGNLEEVRAMWREYGRDSHVRPRCSKLEGGMPG